MQLSSFDVKSEEITSIAASSEQNVRIYTFNRSIRQTKLFSIALEDTIKLAGKIVAAIKIGHTDPVYGKILTRGSKNAYIASLPDAAKQKRSKKQSIFDKLKISQSN